MNKKRVVQVSSLPKAISCILQGQNYSTSSSVLLAYEEPMITLSAVYDSRFHGDFKH